MESGINERLKSFSLTTRQLGLLLVIRENKGITQKEAGEKLRIDRTTMVKLADVLENGGQIKREPKASDRRAYVLSLTEQSANVIDSAVKIVEEYERLVLQNLDSVQKEKFNRMTQIINSKENVNE